MLGVFINFWYSEGICYLVLELVQSTVILVEFTLTSRLKLILKWKNKIILNSKLN